MLEKMNVKIFGKDEIESVDKVAYFSAPGILGNVIIYTKNEIIKNAIVFYIGKELLDNSDNPLTDDDWAKVTGIMSKVTKAEESDITILPDKLDIKIGSIRKIAAYQETINQFVTLERMKQLVEVPEDTNIFETPIIPEETEEISTIPEIPIVEETVENVSETPEEVVENTPTFVENSDVAPIADIPVIEESNEEVLPVQEVVEEQVVEEVLPVQEVVEEQVVEEVLPVQEVVEEQVVEEVLPVQEVVEEQVVEEVLPVQEVVEEQVVEEVLPVQEVVEDQVVEEVLPVQEVVEEQVVEELLPVNEEGYLQSEDINIRILETLNLISNNLQEIKEMLSNENRLTNIVYDQEIENPIIENTNSDEEISLDDSLVMSDNNNFEPINLEEEIQAVQEVEDIPIDSPSIIEQVSEEVLPVQEVVEEPVITEMPNMVPELEEIPVASPIVDESSFM